MTINNININSDEFDNISFYSSKSKEGLDDFSANFCSDFKSFKDSSIYSDGKKIINYQMKKISDNINNVNHLILKYKDLFFDIEKMLDNEAKKIKIPCDFAVNDSYMAKNIKAIDLSKINYNQVINENKETAILSNSFNPNFVKEELNSLENSNVSKVRDYDDSYDINKTVINSFERNTTDKKDFSDFYDLNEKKLFNINNRKVIYDEKFDEYMIE